ncbi:MAG: hypothetical protein HYY49_11595 [Ignavibacteriales bacterium]|nr:hypothetical protein [Ignavibacteriales bacterium]
MASALTKGFAVIIDDDFGKENSDDLIFEIVKKIEEYGIPVYKCDSLARATKFAQNFTEINFIVLDWRLYQFNENVTVTEEIKQDNAKQNVKFLNQLKKICFAPVFLFSSEDEKDVIAELKAVAPELYNDDMQRNFIFVRKKEALVKGNKLFEEISGWIEKNPTIYTLKKWEESFLRSKNDSFWMLFERSPVWPSILWNSFERDSVDESYNIYEQLYRIVEGRALRSPLDKSLVLGTAIPSGNNDIMGVIRATMFVEVGNIQTDDIQPGDIYKMEDGTYLINVRPVCDTVYNRKNKDGKNAFDGDLYLLKGTRIGAEEFEDKHFDKTYGIKQPVNAYVVYGVEDASFYRFQFKKLITKKFDELRTKRIQRLLPPPYYFPPTELFGIRR